MKRITALLLAVLLLLLPVISYTEQTVYQKEENTGRDKDSYPYIIRMPFATWYLAKADIELLGEDAYYEGLYATLDEVEADLADAREALKGYIPDEIAPIDIYTDFCGKAGIAANASAYYNGRGNFIKLFNGWKIARISLQHEYVHYLTMHCAQNPTRFGFWAEGMADYVADHVCKNRLGRSVNMAFEKAGYPPGCPAFSLLIFLFYTSLTFLFSDF